MRNILGWFVHNRVASNLLMWSLIFGGLIALPQLHREEFPNIEVDVINVVVPYPGASPEEVELTVCSRVEEAVTGTPGIKKLTALAAENRCQVTIEVAEGTAKNLLLNEVKGKIDAIDTFPEEAENPVVSLVTILTNVIQMFIYGDTDEVSLKRLAEKVRLDLIDIPGISQVSVHYAKPYEISIEVSENTLRRYGTNLQSIARRVGANSLDLPAGSIDTADGQVLIRTVSKARNIEALENLVVITQQDGSNIRLKDIATVRDGFIKSDIKAAYNSQPALMVGVKRIGNEDVITVAETVKQYVEDIQYELPDGIDIAIWTDESQDLVDRLDALGTNGIGGLVLVLVVLAMFLKPHLAFWVAVGLPITLLGTLMTFPFFGITISTISVVGTLLVLGILVDAGVVVAERIHTNAEQGQKADQAAISGVHDVATPVIFGVLTSMVAFTPLIAMQSSLGSFFSYIGLTVCLA
jgi:multidrug efflux pump subunit AcrB